MTSFRYLVTIIFSLILLGQSAIEVVMGCRQYYTFPSGQTRCILCSFGMVLTQDYKCQYCKVGYIISGKVCKKLEANIDSDTKSNTSQEKTINMNKSQNNTQANFFLPQPIPNTNTNRNSNQLQTQNTANNADTQASTNNKISEAKIQNQNSFIPSIPGASFGSNSINNINTDNKIQPINSRQQTKVTSQSYVPPPLAPKISINDGNTNTSVYVSTSNINTKQNIVFNLSDDNDDSNSNTNGIKNNNMSSNIVKINSSSSGRTPINNNNSSNIQQLQPNIPATQVINSNKFQNQNDFNSNERFGRLNFDTTFDNSNNFVISSTNGNTASQNSNNNIVNSNININSNTNSNSNINNQINNAKSVSSPLNLPLDFSRFGYIKNDSFSNVPAINTNYIQPTLNSPSNTNIQPQLASSSSTQTNTVTRVSQSNEAINDANKPIVHKFPQYPFCFDFDKGQCWACVSGYVLNLIANKCVVHVKPPTLFSDKFTNKSDEQKNSQNNANISKNPEDNCNLYSQQKKVCQQCIRNYYFDINKRLCLVVNPLCRTYQKQTGKCLTCYVKYNLTSQGNCQPTQQRK